MFSLSFPRRSTIVWATLLSALLGVFWFVAEDVAEGETTAFDQMIVGWFRDASNPGHSIGPYWLEDAARDLTSLGSFSILTLVVAFVAGFLLLTRRRADALYVVTAVITGALVSSMLKRLFDRPRPELSASAPIFSASFPSGHATVSAVAYLTLGVLLASEAENRGLAAFFIGAAVFLTVLIGLTRVYLGVHYPTDVIAGWALGTSWALICWSILATVRRQAPAVPSTPS